MVVHADTAGLITQTAGHRFAASIQGSVAANRPALVGHVARDVHVTDALRLNVFGIPACLDDTI